MYRTKTAVTEVSPQPFSHKKDIFTRHMAPGGLCMQLHESYGDVLLYQL